ncbi:MAG: DUF4390 domain-containing protein [FCB group bacterium]|nr:DUF4390 domain-containing protein [FCB group bacterium]
MEPNLFSVLFNKTISTVIALGTLFYSSVTGVSPRMSEVQINARGSMVTVSVQILDSFSPDFDQILSSGMEVKLHYRIQLINQDSPLRAVETRSLTKTLTYSLLDHSYQVQDSRNSRSERELSLNEAKLRWTRIGDLPLVRFDDLKPNSRYLVSVTAWLDKVQVMGKEDPLNLLVYWNGIKPEGTSRPFTRDLLTQ